MPLRRLAAGLVAAVLALGAAAPEAMPAAAPLRILVAYPPGGVSDVIARALAERAARVLDVPVIVENRGGAGGVVAMEALKRAPPDGKTLVFSAVTPLTVAPLLGPVGFDPERDVVPVMSVMVTPVLVLGTASLAGDTMASVVDAAKAKPGAVRWATSGVGTTGHLVLERVRATSGADITHVPYRGGGPQINDALAGEFEVLSSNVGELQLQLVRQGRLKALAVGAPARLAILPDVPTLGRPGLLTPAWRRPSVSSRRAGRRRRSLPRSIAHSMRRCRIRPFGAGSSPPATRSPGEVQPPSRP